MEIRCRCPSCAAKFKVDAKFAGKKARCPKCQTIVPVPTENVEDTSALSAPAAAPAPQPQPGPARPPLKAPPAAMPPAPLPQQPAPQAIAPQSPIERMPAAEQPAASSPFPNLSTDSAPGPLTFVTQPAASKAGDHRSAKGHKKSNPLPLIIGGGVGGLLVAGVAIALVISLGGLGTTPKKKSGTTVAAGSGSATLYIDWPGDERRGGSLTIDGQKRPLTTGGQLKYTLSAGSHQLYLQRRGYEAIDTTVVLSKGESEHFAPQWKASGLAPSVPAGTLPHPSSVSPATGNPMPAGGFPIGTAVTSLSPKGFDGWLQSFDAAKREAQQAAAKDILLVFGCSDAQRATQELAAQLKQEDVKSKLVCVVIDFPRTADGFNLVEDRGQNDELASEFGLDRLPALALADEHGRTYFFNKAWDEGFGGLAEKITEWSSQKSERDSTLASVPKSGDATQLAAAAKAVKWLQDKAVWRFYGPEISGWHTLAKRIDPNNEQALQETFFEPQWFLDLVQLNGQDDGAVVRVAAQLDLWITRGGFKDQDRGAKLHMTAAMLLARVNKLEQSARQLQEAVKYQPQDAKLADALNNLKAQLENKDLLGSGTGFLISSAGYVLTNHHVIDGPGRVEVRIPGTKDTVPAQVIAQDENRDMALLKVTFPEPGQFRPVALLPDEMGRGAEVAAFGYPLSDALGTGLKFTRGAISAVPDATNDDMYLLDLRVNPGNSGGPLCDARGNVVGMITAKTGSGGFEDSYALAIPAVTLLQFLEAHLPAQAPRAAADPAAPALGWDQVDKKVSSGVLMIVKKK